MLFKYVGSQLIIIFQESPGTWDLLGPLCILTKQCFPLVHGSPLHLSFVTYEGIHFYKKYHDHYCFAKNVSNACMYVKRVCCTGVTIYHY